MPEDSDTDLAEVFFKVLSTQTSQATLNRLRLKLGELGDRSKDELELFRVLMKMCRENKALDQAFENAGLGKISEFDIFDPDPKRGELVQAFTTMFERHWREEGDRKACFKPLNAREFSEVTLAPQEGTTMKVHVHAGRNLAVKDIVSSDPYCLLTYSDPAYDQLQKEKTEVIRNTTEPRWTSSYLFSGVSPKGELEIQVWDYDSVGEDDFLGNIIIPMELLDFSADNHRWFKLAGAGTGELRIRVSFSGD